MMDVVAAFGGGEARQTRTEERPERVDRAAAGFADDGFEFGEAQLDGVEVGTVGRQEAQRRAGRFKSVATPSTLCAARLSAITMSPGCNVGTRICSTEARKLAPSIGPSRTPGAVSPVTRARR